MVEYYKMRVLCGNCNTFSEVDIPKGTPKGEIRNELACPNCGVKGYMAFT